MVDNYIKSSEINNMLIKVLDSFDLKYSQHETENSTYYSLPFKKPIDNLKNGHLTYYIVIHISEELNSISLTATDIDGLNFQSISEDLYYKLNFLNASTLMGSVYYIEDYNEKVNVINFRHSFEVFTYDNLIKNLTNTISYIDYYILELYSILVSETD